MNLKICLVRRLQQLSILCPLCQNVNVTEHSQCKNISINSHYTYHGEVMVYLYSTLTKMKWLDLMCCQLSK